MGRFMSYKIKEVILCGVEHEYQVLTNRGVLIGVLPNKQQAEQLVRDLSNYYKEAKTYAK